GGRRPEGRLDQVLLRALVMTGTTALCAALVPPSRALARHFGVIDEPGHRKVHGQPMPRLGGCAVYVSFTAVLLAGTLLAPTLQRLSWVQASFGSSLALLQEAYRVKDRLFAILAGGTLIFAVGLADDVLGKRFPVGVRFAGQIGAALMLVAARVRISLLYHFLPPTVLLGDCGSLYVGFVMGSLTLLERYISHASSTLFPILLPVVVLALPILDTATVVYIRVKERRPIYVGDSRHLSHRLVSLGFSQRTAVLFLYLVTFALGLGAASLPDATVGQAL